MGSVNTIGYDFFPKQGRYFGKEVLVCFDHDMSRILKGRIVRDDAEEPYQTIILLEDGRYVLSSECQYRLAD